MLQRDGWKRETPRIRRCLDVQVCCLYCFQLGSLFEPKHLIFKTLNKPFCSPSWWMKVNFICIWRSLLQVSLWYILTNTPWMSWGNFWLYTDSDDDLSTFLRHYFRYSWKQGVKRGDDRTKAIRTCRKRHRPLEHKRETYFTKITQQVHQHEAFCNNHCDILYCFT